MINRRNFVALLAGTIGFSSLGSCRSPSSAPQEILIGATYPATGVFASIAGPFGKLMDAWAAMVNETGGLYLKDYDRKLPIRFITYDDGSNTEKSRQLYKKLIVEDQVHLLMGPYGSDITMGASAVAEKYQKPMIFFEANSGPIFTRGFQWIGAVMASGGQWAHNYFEMLKAKTDAKTVAFVVEDRLHPKEVYEGATQHASQLGFTVAYDRILRSGTDDFAEVIAALKQANPDVVYVSALPPFAIQFAKQAKALGLSPKALHIVHHKLIFLKRLGLDAELVTGDTFWTPAIQGEGKPEFEALLKRVDLTVTQYPETAIRMFGFQALRATLAQSGSLDPTKFIAALRSLDTMTIGGRLTIAPDGSGSMNPIPTQIQQGQYVTIWPQTIATNQYEYPRNA